MASESSLSIGKHLRAALLADQAVKAAVNDIYPLTGWSQELPYIAYAVTGIEAGISKSIGPDCTFVELAVYAETYDQAVEIAEAVRDALYKIEDPLMGPARVINQKDAMANDDTYMKILTIRILTSPLN